jgi:sugar/nucleoside kinase (ribokinase family)
MRRDRLIVDERVCWGTGLFALDIIVEGQIGEKHPTSAGGSCCNILAILAWLGWKVYPLAARANDPAGLILWNDLSDLGLATSHLEVSSVFKTPVIVEYLRRNGQDLPVHRFDFVCPFCRTWFPRFRGITLEAASRIRRDLPVPSVFVFDRVTPAALALASEARDQKALVIFDISARQESKLLMRALELSHVVKWASGNVDLTAEQKAGQGASLLIETMGVKGLQFSLPSKASAARKWKRLPAFNLGQAIDTVGAGDWFTAGLAYSLQWDGIGTDSLSGVEYALQFSQALAAVSTLFVGARGVMYRLSPKQATSLVAQALGGDSISLVVRSEWGGRSCDIRKTCTRCLANTL